jgi:hypothetical protein
LNSGECMSMLMNQLLLILMFAPFILGFQLQNRPVHIFMIGDSTMADNRPDGVQDDTHLNPEGAAIVARMAGEEMKALKLPLLQD